MMMSAIAASPASLIGCQNGAITVPCLLYTSDAADDLLCVDLGGRRIIKKKKKTQTINPQNTTQQNIPHNTQQAHKP